MHLHVTNVQGEWTHTSIFFTCVGLCLLATVVIVAYKLAKG